MIPIELSAGSSSLQADAYVDSGAMCSLFGQDSANQLGLNLVCGRKICLIVGDGKIIHAKMLKLPVKIGDESFISEIAFSSQLGVGFNLLGRKGIFEHFEQVVFKERQRKVLFKK